MICILTSNLRIEVNMKFVAKMYLEVFKLWEMKINNVNSNLSLVFRKKINLNLEIRPLFKSFPL